MLPPSNCVGGQHSPSSRRAVIEILQLAVVAGALIAFYLAIRVLAVERPATDLHRRSALLLALAALSMAVLVGAEALFAPQDQRPWWSLALAAATVLLLIAGYYALYVHELEGVHELAERARGQQHRSGRLEAILELGNQLRTTLDPDEVAHLAADTVRDTLNYRETALYVYDAETHAFKAGAVYGQDPEYDGVVRQRLIPAGLVQGLVRDEFRQGECFVIDHARYTWSDEELFYFPPGELPDLGPGMFHRDDAVFVPLYDHDQHLIGLFDVYDPADGRLPSPEALQLLQIFANVTASALENARAGQELRQLAVTDGLTGLYNHRHFQEALAREVARAERYDLVFTLLMMDLDLFKAVNDRLGHPRGDEALQQVAAVLRDTARTSDFVARYGGEEFVMILPGTTVKQAGTLAQRIAEGVRAIEIDVPRPPRLTISIGMADHPACGRDRESLIAAADAALLFAKRSGRDMIADFSEISLTELDEEGLEGLAFRLEKADRDTLAALAGAIAMRDAWAPPEGSSAATLAPALASAMGLGDAERELFATAAVVYDIGKVAIPVEVLNRRGDLTPKERAAIRSHPEVGGRLLESIMRLRAALPAVVHHHERWDGSGYPDGLKGEEIPLMARAMAICDAYQAMIADRPYRKALSQTEALGQLREGAGTQFDPHLVEVFVDALATSGASA